MARTGETSGVQGSSERQQRPRGGRQKAGASKKYHILSSQFGRLQCVSSG